MKWVPTLLIVYFLWLLYKPIWEKKVEDKKRRLERERKIPRYRPLQPALKARILDSLAKVKGNSFAAFCIQLFVKNAHIKTDYEVKQMVKGLQSQINDNPAVLMRVLGNQYDFIRSVKWSEAFV